MTVENESEQSVLVDVNDPDGIWKAMSMVLNQVIKDGVTIPRPSVPTILGYQTKKFISRRFKPEQLQLRDQCLTVIAEKGRIVSLRELYYGLVTKNQIENTDDSYDRLGSSVKWFRLAGLIPWELIEDRSRDANVPPTYESADDFMKTVLPAFKLDHWKPQHDYCEIWVEKDALVNVLRPVAQKYQIALVVCRGNISWSEIKEAADRFREARYRHKQLHLFYLTDCDPSGIDMLHEVNNRFAMLDLYDLEVERLALTPAQVQHYGMPPNPIKLKDKKQKAFRLETGLTDGYELDAMPQEDIAELVDQRIAQLIDQGLWQQVLDRETEEAEKLKRGS